MKKLVAVVLSILLIFSAGIISYADSAADLLEVEHKTESEYNIIMSEIDSLKLSDPKAAKAEFIKYQESFKEMSSLPKEVLQGYGYNDEQIAIMKEYLEGSISFEKAASISSATLTTYLTATTYTSTLYIITYNWIWSALPIGLDKDAAALGVYAFDNSNLYCGVALSNYSSKISYYYTSGTFYAQENATIVPETTDINSKFDFYKQDSTNTQNVWAKSGYIVIQATPAVPGGSFGAMRARAEYGHAKTTINGIVVSFIVQYLTGNLDFTFVEKFTNQTTNITEYGHRQTLFRTNGNHLVEI